MDKILIANQKDVTQLLPMAECIDVMTETLRALAEGKALLPLRNIMVLPGGENVMSLMPSYLDNIQALGVKVITAFTGNFGSEYDTHQGVVLLFDAQHGALRAIVDGTSITAIRTAAVSGLATRLLAREEAGDLALIGAGTQAHTHLEAMKCVRKIRRVRVFSLPLDGAYAFAERESKRHGIPVEVKETAREAVEGRRYHLYHHYRPRAGAQRGVGVCRSAYQCRRRLHTFHPRIRFASRSPGAFIRRPEGFHPARSRRVPDPEIGRSLWRRSYRRRAGRIVDRKSRRSQIIRRDHPVQVARACD